jgi:hypothetical protein
VLPQAVTTVWRTELGTTLVFGFNSTTEESAYFHYLCFYQSAMHRRMNKVPLPYGPAPRGRFTCGGYVLSCSFRSYMSLFQVIVTQ